MVDSPNTIWRDYNTDGDPGSLAYAPEKSKIREWANYVQGLAEAGSTVALSNPVTVEQGGTGQTTPEDARAALEAAKSGANTDIESLGGLTTPLSIDQGGTGATTEEDARTAIGAAKAGVNDDITSITALSTPLSIAQGGTGATTAADALSELGAAAAAAVPTLTQFNDLTTTVSGKASASLMLSVGGMATGGGNLNADRTITVDINALTEKLSVDGTADYLPLYDGAGTAHKKIKAGLVAAAIATGVGSFNGRTGAVSPASADYNAGQITNTPSGNLASTDVQSALNELDTEKAALAGATFTGNTGISKATPYFTINASASGQLKGILVQTGGLARWAILGDSTAEANSADGSDLVIISYDNSGNPLATVFKITRSTGKVTLAASNTTSARFNLPHGTAPSAPADGDLWTTTAGVYGRVNGSTVLLGGTGSYFSSAGGTLTGDVTIDESSASLTLKGTAGNLRGVYIQTGTALRWALLGTATAESGSNAGTNVRLIRYDDSGVQAGYTEINRATGQWTFEASTTAGASLNIPQGTAPTSAANGDVWMTSTGMQARYGGNTRTFASVEAPSFTANVTTSGSYQIGGTDVVDANRIFVLRSYTYATLPAATTAGQMVRCTDLGGGSGLLVSDGATWKRTSNGYGTMGNADKTISILADANIHRAATTLTADRTLTLSNTDAYVGAEILVYRTAGGAFNLNVNTNGGSLLKSLAANTFARCVFNGTDWQISSYGSL